MSPAPPLNAQEDPLNWSADETIAAIKSKRITVRDYISGALDRAEKGKSLNAFINLLPEQALSEADKIDDVISRGEPLPPLAGLAIVAKDNINFAGFPTTAGTSALRDSLPSTTAPSLKKLMMAGAIVIGKTNMHELAFGATSSNLTPFAGIVHNPYDVTKIPGGSSGGTAVAIASRVVSCGLGTDTGGSARIPAALTGTVGFRPSVGDGGSQRRYHDENAVVPISHTRDTVGVMGRTVADVILLDSIISERKRVEAVQLRGVRIGIPPVLWSGLDKQLEAVVLEAQSKLAKAGVVFVKDDMPNLLDMDGTIGLPLALHEPLADIPAYLNASGVKNVTLDTIFSDIASPDVKTIFESVMNDALGADYDDVVKVRRPALQKMYVDYFGSHKIDAILFPTTILPAVTIDKEHGSSNVSINGGPPMDEFSTFIRNASPGSDAGIPGLSVPVGMTASGLPVGIEIDGPLGSDERLLSLGLALEQVFGHLPPPKM